MSYPEYSMRRLYGWLHMNYVTARVRWRCWQIERLMRQAERLLSR